MHRFTSIFLWFLLMMTFISCQNTQEKSITWMPGYLDIHHIHSGRGNAAYMVFPDGTSMLFDAGMAKQRDTKPYYPVYPTDSLSPAGWIAHYINEVNPREQIDYGVISHFHADHYGHVDSTTRMAGNGKYRLSGITEVGDLIPIRKMIDRGFPRYDYPFELLGTGRMNLDNYVQFLDTKIDAGEMIAESLTVGATDQIQLKYAPNDYPEFEVLNLKSNQWFWSKERNEPFEFEFTPSLVNEKGYYNENPLSLCLQVSYGDFDYFTGGDLPGVNDYPDYDMETPMGQEVGEVDALSLNHHGYHDATNPKFLELLNPQVAVHQCIHDPHFQENVITNLANQKVKTYAIMSTGRLAENIQSLMNEVYESTHGHVLIRVYPGGETFQVMVLDYEGNELKVLAKSEMYQSRK